MNTHIQSKLSMLCKLYITIRGDKKHESGNEYEYRYLVNNQTSKFNGGVFILSGLKLKICKALPILLLFSLIHRVSKRSMERKCFRSS